MHGTPTSPKFRVFGRDDSGGGGLSTGTVIIIAVVCGCVAILALALFLWRLLARCCRPKEKAPLPPVQDLAHHRREQQRAAFANGLSAPSRPVTWVDSLGPSRTPHTGSAVSLLTNPDNNPSVYTDDMMTTESTLASPDGDNKLYPPNPSFYRNSDASSSRNTFNDNASSSHSSLVNVPSLPSMPISDTASAASHAVSHSRSQSRQTSVSQPPSTRSRSRVPSRGRPLSQVSDSPTSHSGFTMRSSSTFRGGPPHRSGSMQIILPAPLGPQPLYAGENHSLYHNPQVSRSSVFADQWVSNGARSSSAEPTREGRTSSKSRSRSRHREMPSIPEPPPQSTMPSSSYRRAESQPRSRTNFPQLPETSSDPYAPPRAYGNLADLATSAYDDEAVRGRSRTTSNPLQQIPSGQMSP